jgi:DNA-binding transcriptional LysR family regulator
MAAANLHRATVHQLRIFETVARHSSFSRAAAELHLTQPAVSIQVKQLEGHAGAALFEQLGRHLHLTAAGQALLHHSRAIIGEFREAEDAMAQYRGIAGGTLNVAVISAGDYFFPQLLAEFGRRVGGVALNLVVTHRKDVLEQLADNVTDLAIMVRPPSGGSTVASPFAPAPYVVVAAPDHRLARKRRITLDALAAEPFISRERASDTWNAMEAAFGARLARLRILMEISSNDTIKQAVSAGLGLGFLSVHSIDAERRLGTLAVLDVAGFPLLRRWHLVHRKGKRLSPVALAFKSFLLEDGARLIERLTHTARRARRSG